MKMKKIICIMAVAFATVMLSGCHDRDVLDSKAFAQTLPKIENASYTQEGSTVRLSWTIPADISPAFRRPLEVSIQRVENNIYREIITVHGEGTASHDILINSERDNRFIIKLHGYLLDDAREVGKPDRVYSEGAVITIP